MSKKRQIGVRLSEEDYAKFEKIAESRYLLVASLATILVKNCITEHFKKGAK